MLYKMF